MPGTTILEEAAPAPSVLAPELDNWCAIQTRIRFERKICQQIQNKRHDAYVPIRRERRRWSDRMQSLEIPLFPGYVFVREASCLDDRLAVVQTRGVYRFVMFQGAVAHIPLDQILLLRRLEQQNSECSPYAYLKAGQRVRVRGGCLDGLEGFFVCDRGKKLVVTIEPLQRSIALDVDTYDLELVWQGTAH